MSPKSKPGGNIMSQSRFVISHDGLELGPFSKAVVLEKLNGGELDPIDYIYVDELKDWIMLAEFQNRETLQEVPHFSENPPPAPSVPVAEPEVVLEHTATGFEIDPDDLRADLNFDAILSPEISVMPEEVQPQDQNDNDALDMDTAPDLKMPHPSDLIERIFPETRETALKSVVHSQAQANAELSQTLHLKQGQGVFEVPSKLAGRFHIQIKSPSDLEVDPPIELLIKSGQVEKIEVHGPESILAGAPATFRFRALDEFGNPALGFSEAIDVRYSPAYEGAPSQVKFHDGNGELTLNLTLASEFNLSFLNLPQSVKSIETKKITVKPGPAKKLKVQSPSEALAGQPVQIMVTAVDEYGNPTDLETDVEVEIKTA